MCAQEDMIHSLVHNIAMEFSSFSQKNGGQGAGKSGPGASKKKADTSSSSILDDRVQQAYSK